MPSVVNGRTLVVSALVLASTIIIAPTPAAAQQAPQGTTPFGLAQAERAKTFASLPNWTGLWNPLEFVVTPEQTWIIWEYGPQLRRIFTDGRGHQPEDEQFDSWTGHSIGRWE